MSVLERHRWNTGFTWPAHRGPFVAVAEEQARRYDELGYFVLEDAIDPGAVAALDAAIEPFDRAVVDFLAARPGGRFDIAGVDTVSISLHLARRSDVLRGFCATGVLAELASDLVGPEVRLYWDQAVYKRPHGAEPLLWHQDNGYAYVEPQDYLTCWVALTDADLDNGCVWVVPGVHRLGTLAHRATPIGYECFAEHPDAVPVPVRAGSIVVFSSLTPHMTGRNTTDAVRKAYIVQYAPDGAVAYRGDESGAMGAPESQDDPDRQFRVVHGGDVTRTHPG